MVVKVTVFQSKMRTSKQVGKKEANWKENIGEMLDCHIGKRKYNKNSESIAHSNTLSSTDRNNQRT